MGDWQRNIVVGTVLGGSSLVKPSKGVNYYLSMRSKTPVWLSYKMQELEEFFQDCQLRLDKKTFRCNSMCSTFFTEMHDLMYKKNEKIVSEEVLYPLKDIGLAIWFLEGGGICGRHNKNIYLNTTKFKEEGSTVIANYFNDMDMFCTKSVSPNRIRIIFSIDSSEKFTKIIADKVPHFMMDYLNITTI